MNICYIITSPQPWDTWPRKPFIQQIAKVVAKDGGIVLGLEPTALSIFNLFVYPKRIINWLLGRYRFRKVDDNIYAFSPFTIEHILASVRFKPVLLINKILLKFELKRVLRKIGIDPKNTVLILHRPELFFLKGLIGEKGIVYDCSDDFCITSTMGKMKVLGNKEREQYLSHNSDLVIASSQKLYLRNKSCNINTFLMVNGYSSSVFENYEFSKIEKIENLKKPIIGYIGNVRSWVDFKLLNAIISEKPNWTFLFVGSISKESQKDFAELENKYTNIISVKKVSYKEFPNYLQYFDVGLIPFKVNEFMESVNPNKLYEYLSMGISVVGTNFGDLEKDYQPYVKVGNNDKEFLKKIEEIIDMPCDAKNEYRTRIHDFGNQFTWENNAERLYEYIRNIIFTKQDISGSISANN